MSPVDIAWRLLKGEEPIERETLREIKSLRREMKKIGVRKAKKSPLGSGKKSA